MAEKIKNHQKERQGSYLKTVEEKIDIANVIEQKKHGAEVMIIDCLTMWINNLLFFIKEQTKRESAIDNFLASLSGLSGHCIIISNETGMGIMPDNPLARKYGEELGKLNQGVSSVADNVVLMVSGIPVFIKGKL